MWNLTRRNLIANKARMALITLAVVIGVSFVSSTFIFSDSLQRTFDGLATDMVAGTDLEVRPVAEFGSVGTLTDATVDTVAAVDGVDAVGATRSADNILPIDPSGDLVSGFGVGIAWVDDQEISGFDLVVGAAPGDGEFVMSQNVALRDGFEVGSSYQISTPTGLADRTLSGLVEFVGGEAIEDSLTFTLLPLDDAQQLFGGAGDRVDSISVRVADSAAIPEVQTRIDAALGDQLEVVSQRTVEEEQAAQFNSQISILRNVLLGFAVVSLFVSTYIIYNTFGIILTQRVREIGLLRAIGADAAQVGRSIMAEALVIGTFAAAAGLAAGVALNAGLVVLFDALGAPLPEIDTIIATRTVVLAFAIGIGVTLLSSLGPARQARRVSPMTAMNGADTSDQSSRRRVLTGSVLAGLGAALAANGLFAASGATAMLTSLGLGIALIFLGITLLSPALAKPVIALVGAPAAKLGGVTGVLAQQNAARNPRRTANTSAALMVGLSLITTVLVVGQSVKGHLRSTLANSVTADFVISNDFEPMGSNVIGEVEAIEELDSVLAVSEIGVLVNGEIRQAETLNFGPLGELFDLGVTSGSVPTGDDATAMLSGDIADELGLSLGDSLAVTFENGSSETFTVESFYTDTTLLETGIMLSRPTIEDATGLASVDWVAADRADGVSAEAADAALIALATEFPQIDVQTRAQYQESVEDQIDQLLSIVNVMLALSIVIALIGIGLTLALSVFERTREIGLLRAVGMTRRQVRRMIRWEAALIALFGAVLGVGTGLLYGWGTVAALPNTIASSLEVPTAQLALLLIASAIAGLMAALLPARRAGRMNVLDAITGR